MSILIIQNDEGGATTAAAINFAGATALSATGEVITGGRVNFQGSTALAPSGSLATHGAVAFTGSTAITFNGRLNAEANVFGAANFEGSTALSLGGGARSDAGVNFAGASIMTARGLVVTTEDFGFTFFIDAVNNQIASAVAAHLRRYSARLKVDGVVVPIRSAELSTPEDRLGTELSVILARPDVSQISSTAVIDFDLGTWAGGAMQWTPIMTGGKLSSRGARYANAEGLPSDSVEVVFVDIVGDRWNRAPSENRILYDPERVDAPTPESIAEQTIFDALGAPIYPVFVAVPGMRLKDVLQAAYVEGCGFSKVTTNLDNFPVEQVVFTLTGGYDAAVRPLVSLFEPLAYPVGSELWLMQTETNSSSIFPPRIFAASNSKSISDDLPSGEPTTALLVTVSEDVTLETWDEVEETPLPESSGIFGTPDFTETTRLRRLRRYHPSPGDATVSRVDVVFEQTTVEDYEFNVISRERRTDTFDALNRRTGYTRTLDTLLPPLSDPSGTRTLQRSEAEYQLIAYSPHPLNPARDVQSHVETHTSGLILVDSDNQYLDKPYRLPYKDAHVAGYIQAGAGQATTFGEIRSVILSLRVQGDQVLRERRVINHVAAIPTSLTVETLPGDASLDRRGAQRTRTILLRTPGASGTTTRRVPSYDASALPQALALTLARRHLARLNSPPRAVAVEVPYVDLSLRRGITLDVRGRTGSLGVFVIRGLSISIEEAEAGAVTARMTLRARELK